MTSHIQLSLMLKITVYKELLPGINIPTQINLALQERVEKSEVIVMELFFFFNFMIVV